MGLYFGVYWKGDEWLGYLISWLIISNNYIVRHLSFETFTFRNLCLQNFVFDL